MKELIPSTVIIAEYFSKNVNWDFFYSSLDTLGNSLNSPKNRFDKSDILELAIEVFSDEKIKHFNQTGRDFYIPELNCHCEMKFSENLLYTSTGTLKSKESLTLVNTMGSNIRDSLPVTYSPFLIAVGSKGCAIVSKKTLEKYLDTKSDSGQIKAKDIPITQFVFVKRTNEIKNRRVIPNIDYSDEKLKLQKTFLNKFKEILKN
jgi:hypothetical protein